MLIHIHKSRKVFQHSRGLAAVTRYAAGKGGGNRWNFAFFRINESLFAAPVLARRGCKAFRSYRSKHNGQE